MLLACPQCQTIEPNGLDNCGKKFIVCLSCNASFALQKKPWREAEPKIEVQAAPIEDKTLSLHATNYP